jgi:eukaryotic-like serine/threonine-protein kinase
VIARTVIGERYRIEGLIGSGGFAQVFDAMDLSRGEPVALKLMRERWRGDVRVNGQFVNESLALRRLHGLATPILYAEGVTGDRLRYIAMDRVPGKSFGELLDAELPLGVVLDSFRALLDVLEQVHQRGVVHGDLKANNVLIDAGVARDATMLIDFGLAVVVEDRPRRERVSAWSLGGTPEFMAPELSQGGQRSVASDVYAAGGILYELLTGCPPFSGGSSEDVAAHHRHEAVIPPSALARFEIVPALDAIVLRALAKRPTDRFVRAADLSTALESIARVADDTGAVRPRFTSVGELPTWRSVTPVREPGDEITQR